MADDPVSPGGSSNPRLPWVLFAAAVAFAVLATTGFIYLLGKSTTGPVEVLRAFYQAAREGDCEEAYSYLVEHWQAQQSESEWCSQSLPEFEAPVSFEVVRVTLKGDTAIVLLRLPDGSMRGENLEREGSTWRIGFTPDGEP